MPKAQPFKIEDGYKDILNKIIKKTSARWMYEN